MSCISKQQRHSDNENEEKEDGKKELTQKKAHKQKHTCEEKKTHNKLNIFINVSDWIEEMCKTTDQNGEELI